jgi:hypothetical protein
LTAIVSRVAAGDASSRSILMAFLAAANSDSVTLIERRAATTFSNAWKQREKVYRYFRILCFRKRVKGSSKILYLCHGYHTTYYFQEISNPHPHHKFS